MSRVPHEASNVPNTGFSEGDHRYQPPSAQNQASHGVSNFVDGSGPIFSMYMEMAMEEDKKMVENWKADADGILIFTGLFSAAVASLISVSIQDIRPNPQDTSNFYLANIYQTTVNPNISTSLPTSPPPFSPPNYAVWVNSLWFLSLVISLTCALLATLVQQWARRYLKVTQTRYSPHKQARIRAFFAEGIDKYLLPSVVETLPALLHISLFLFFAGLVVFLHNVNITNFKLVLSWVGICTAVYGCITVMPIIRHDSPYYTSLSSSVWLIVTGMPYVIYGVFRWFTWSVYFHYRTTHFRGLKESYRKLLVQGMQKTAEETALKSPSAIDTRAFMWTFDCLDEDKELERFFSGLPGIRSSKVVKDPLPSLTGDAKDKLSNALTGFFYRTLSSDLLPGSVKNHRAISFAKALDPLQFPYAFWHVLHRVISSDQHSGLQTTEFIRVMRGWRSGGDQRTQLLGEAMFTCLIAGAQRRDNSWLISAPNRLGISEADLRRYTTDGNLSLTSLICITRHQFSQFGKPSWPAPWFSQILEKASEFDVRDTSPNLRHEFCALWNQIVLNAQNDGDRRMATWILRPIRKVYITLHEGTDAAPTQFSASTDDYDDVLFDPSSYPQCDFVSHIHDPSSTTAAHSVLHDNDAPLPDPLTSSDVPSLSAPAPPQVLESLTDIPLDNCHPQTAHQTTTEVVSFSITSPDPATADAFVTSGRTILHPTSATSTSAPLLSSTSPPAAITLQHNADLMAPSDPPNHPSSASHIILENTLSTECHRSAIVPTMPSAAMGPASVPYLCAAARGDGSGQPGSCKEEDALDSRSVNRAIHTNIMTPESPSQSPLLPSNADSDVAVAAPALRAERTGDHSPHPPHFMYDIV